MQEPSLLFFLDTKWHFTGPKNGMVAGEGAATAPPAFGRQMKAPGFFELLGALTDGGAGDKAFCAAGPGRSSLVSESAGSVGKDRQLSDAASLVAPCFTGKDLQPALIVSESDVHNSRAAEKLPLLIECPAVLDESAAADAFSSGQVAGKRIGEAGVSGTFELGSTSSSQEAECCSTAGAETRSGTAAGAAILAEGDEASRTPLAGSESPRSDDTRTAENPAMSAGLSPNAMFEGQMRETVKSPGSSEAANLAQPAMIASDGAGLSPAAALQKVRGLKHSSSICERSSLPVSSDQGEQALSASGLQQAEQGPFPLTAGQFSARMIDQETYLPGFSLSSRVSGARVEALDPEGLRPLIKAADHSKMDAEAVSWPTNHCENAAADGAEKVQSQGKAAGPEIILQIAQKTAVGFKNGQSEISFHLKPDHLGHLQVTIATENNQVHLRIIADAQMVKETLEHHADMLKSSLESHGLEIESFEVCVAHGDEQDSSRREESAFQHAPAWQEPAAEQRPLVDEKEQPLEASRYWYESAAVNCFA